MMCNFDIMRIQTNFINVAQAAEILHISVRAVQHRITRGDIPAQKLPGKTGAYILDREEIESIARADAA